MQMVMDSPEGSMLLGIPPQLQYGILSGLYLSDAADNLAAIRAQLCDTHFAYVLNGQVRRLQWRSILHPY